MKQVALTDFETYMETALDTLSNVTTVGALNAGSITSGFGNIDTGSSNITTTGTVTTGNLVVNGTQTIVNSTTVTIDDPIFQVGGDSAPGSDDNKDRGIAFRVNDGGSNSDALYIYGSTSDVSLLNTKMLRWGGESGTTRIYGDSSGDLMTFVTNNSERLRIASAGQIGIGGANYGTDGQVLTSQGASSPPQWEDAGGGGGITEADQWRLSASTSGGYNSNLTDWERVDYMAGAVHKIGTGMSKDGIGVFTFPSTGIWYVELVGDFDIGGADTTCQVQIQVTSNNSSYTTVANAATGLSLIHI